MTIEEEPDMAYLHLISAIEVLCNDAIPKNKSISDLRDGKEWSKILESIENPNLKNEIQDLLIKRSFFQFKFEEFILNHIKDEFWDDDTRPIAGRIELNELPKLLKRIYNQRSRTLHDGKPFSLNIFYSPGFGEEMDDIAGIVAGKRKWKSKNILPYPHFFERLVNHVLKTFLKRNQVKIGD